MYDIVIVGGGTAGLTAAIYAVRAGKTALILEAKSYGGQIINSPDVENYPGIAHISGFEFAQGLYEQAKALGACYEQAKVEKIQDNGDIKIVKTSDNDYEARSVILATGAKNRPLGVEREEEFIGAGVSYCATCDGAFFRGKEVAIVGGGNTALEDALFLSNHCLKVYLIHRRDEFRGDKKDVQALEDRENVLFILDSVVTKLIGNQTIDGIEVKNVKTDEVSQYPVSGLFVAVGQMPDNEAFKELVELSDGGYIKAGEECTTKTPGIFVAGDCRTKNVRQLATAASDGAVAALAACNYIK